VSIIRTGRPVTLAASAVRIVPGQTMLLPPKPPPTCSASTRTPSLGTPNFSAR
jgi:hypothetical protein